MKSRADWSGQTTGREGLRISFPPVLRHQGVPELPDVEGQRQPFVGFVDQSHLVSVDRQDVMVHVPGRRVHRSAQPPPPIAFPEFLRHQAAGFGPGQEVAEIVVDHVTFLVIIEKGHREGLPPIGVGLLRPVPTGEDLQRPLHFRLYVLRQGRDPVVAVDARPVAVVFLLDVVVPLDLEYLVVPARHHLEDPAVRDHHPDVPAAAAVPLVAFVVGVRPREIDPALFVPAVRERQELADPDRAELLRLEVLRGVPHAEQVDEVVGHPTAFHLQQGSESVRSVAEVRVPVGPELRLLRDERPLNGRRPRLSGTDVEDEIPPPPSFFVCDAAAAAAAAAGRRPGVIIGGRTRWELSQQQHQRHRDQGPCSCSVESDHRLCTHAVSKQKNENRSTGNLPRETVSGLQLKGVFDGNTRYKLIELL